MDSCSSYTSNSGSSSSYSVRKIPAKKSIMKKSISPLPPIPPKIYKVDPINFRDVVQRLTGGVVQPTRLREAAPPPLSLSPAAALPEKMRDFMAEMEEELKPRKMIDDQVGFGLSPSSIAWCSSILMSPKTMEPFKPSTVL